MSVKQDIVPVLVPGLQDLIAREGLDASKLTVLLLAGAKGKIKPGTRERVTITDSVKVAYWETPSLRALFRGDRQPPPHWEMKHYPPEYVLYFYFIEKHLLTAARTGHPPTDQEMEAVYSAFRRRPDSRSLGGLHDFVWQVAALMLGQYALSGAEFEAIFGQLENSTRGWALRPVSRNYIEYLQTQLEGRSR